MTNPEDVSNSSGQLVDRSIGDLIKELRQLDARQVELVLQHQRQHGVRFGEAAIALKLASRDDVLWALSQQFHYPYAVEGGLSGLSEELVAATDPFSKEAEVFRDVRSQLLMGVMAPDQPRRALAVLSPDVGDGKTFFAANLAVTFSQLGESTLLIDADMRTPRQHLLFGLQPGSGLSNILAGRATTDVITPVPALPGMHLLTVGTLPPNPLELMQRANFSFVMQELLTRFDHVLVDTPAAVHGADGRVLAARCGAALVIGRRGRTRMDALQNLVSQIGRSHAKIAGVMLNEH
ncbi:polysaccharide biosynthesis tyrosine autokinase [Pseudorhodoferax sp. Leaf267]|uniref:polysaccharide biosynthesis tyrosine autokinase n=1 Tax=Pseudorhodoferax sp. Leaf267 TaxID=1736316 RepID=UPI0009EA5784|nr:polysaccharide biosynthesis tyrosine autokinase [Pseudorhodoferax sp. Leaf267]